jgi:uncharacterized 2Fe-2S/4Fe-4S cluster protein (DUF4445 family)
MREAELPVLVEPVGKTVYVLRGTRLVEAAAEAGVVLEMPCGGEGVCQKCRVRVVRGAGRPTPVEESAFSAAELQAGLRLACQSAVEGPTTLEVPETSLPAAHHKILARALPTAAPTGDPPVRKQYVELSPPRRGDDDPDLLRLEKLLGPFEVDLAMLRTLSARLRETDFRGTAVLAEGRLIDFEPQNTTAEALAVATDVGTTTLVSALLDLTTGRELAVASRLNPQTRFGDDVLSRIAHVQDAPEGLQQLHEALTDAVDEMLGELCAQAGAVRGRIYALSFSGNTTMQQLLCKVDPRCLGQVPFVPTMGHGLVLPAAELGLHVHPAAAAYVMPVIGGFVGGDTVAGILATELVETAGPTLLVDIGTNGEIVLWAKGKLTAASTAAGPAFEGARISHGMRGSSGAIEKVVVDGQLRINVIGNVPPVGLCGSGLIDAAAELLRHKILTPQGRLQTPDQLPAGVLPELAQRITLHDGQVAFLLATAGETGTGQPVLLTQRDFRELQLAAGAIRAGVATLLRRAGLRAEDLEAVLLCGGFGNFIRRSNAQRIGLLPGSIPRQRIRFQGNTSLAGARLTALSRQARQVAEDLARRTEHVDLSAQPDFRTIFADAMIFPGTGE